MCSINHEKKAIFFHIPKTAGTFIRENLEKYYGFTYYQIKRPDHDKICKTFDYLENIQKNYHSKYKIYGILKYFENKPHNRNFGIYEYAKDSEYINNIINMDNDKWKNYYKFCFIRNPYERFVSGFNYVSKYLNNNILFEKYIDYKNTVSDFEYIHTFMPQSKHIYYHNENIMNYIGHFENLENDFKNILLTIGFKENEIIHDHQKKNVTIYNSLNYYINNQDILDKLNIVLQEDLEKLNYQKKLYINDI